MRKKARVLRQLGLCYCLTLQTLQVTPASLQCDMRLMTLATMPISNKGRLNDKPVHMFNNGDKLLCFHTAGQECLQSGSAQDHHVLLMTTKQAILSSPDHAADNHPIPLLGG